jgi:hypothetical protein
MIGDVGRHHHPRRQPTRSRIWIIRWPRWCVIDHISSASRPGTPTGEGSARERGLSRDDRHVRRAEIHVAQYKSYHTVTPNGYNLQISYNTHDTRLNLAVAVNPRRPG